MWCEPRGKAPPSPPLQGVAVNADIPASLFRPISPSGQNANVQFLSGESSSEILASASSPPPLVSLGLSLFRESEQFVAITTLSPTPEGLNTSLPQPAASQGTLRSGFAEGKVAGPVPSRDAGWRRLVRGRAPPGLSPEPPTPLSVLPHVASRCSIIKQQKTSWHVGRGWEASAGLSPRGRPRPRDTACPSRGRSA